MERSLALLGDIHGNIPFLSELTQKLEGSVEAVVQVGDFGISPTEVDVWKKEKWSFKVPVYFIKGNHEFFDVFDHLKVVTEILPNCFYVPQGAVLELAGKRMAFLGGAKSIDAAYNAYWDEREAILPTDVLTLYDNVFKEIRPIDILVTHVPPHSVIKANFNDRGKLAFGVGLDWEDPNGKVVEEVWKKLGRPMMICGHMHKAVQFDNNSRILDINELFIYPSLYSTEK